MSQLQRITDHWLEKQRQKLRMTAVRIPVREVVGQDDDGDPIYGDTDDSEPNPAYERLKHQIEAAELHHQTWTRLKEKATKAGYRPNSYEGTCAVTGETVKAGAGFVKKAGGRWKTYSVDAVIEALGVKIEGLPAIED